MLAEQRSRILICLLFLLIAFAYKTIQNQPSIRAISTPKASYACDPLFSFDRVSKHVRHFRKITSFMPDLFQSELIDKMGKWIDLPRNWYFTNDVNGNNIHIETAPGRKSVLHPKDRILRWILQLKGLKGRMMEVLFDQDESVVSRDFVHCSIGCICALSDQYLPGLDPNSKTLIMYYTLEMSPK